jgi:predicted nucleic acid-binding protein
MPVVLDSSIVLAMAMDDEEARLAEEAIRAAIETGAVAPTLFWYEVRNALIVNQRRGRISAERILEFLGEIDALPVRWDFPPPSERTIELAHAHQLTVYDAAYLELAIRLDEPLAPLDQRLQTAARTSGAKVFEA